MNTVCIALVLACVLALAPARAVDFDAESLAVRLQRRAETWIPLLEVVTVAD